MCMLHFVAEHAKEVGRHLRQLPNSQHFSLRVCEIASEINGGWLSST
jgi:hypothetical protein